MMSDSNLTKLELYKLEELVDARGIENVLIALSEMCGLKADHIDHNWQDKHLARAWRRLEGAIGAGCVTLAGGL
jgi:hypothetical protein